MTMTPSTRKFALTAHITFSVGWLGAVAVFLAIAIAGLTSQNAQIIRSSYLSMDLITWFVIIPACIGAILTGIIQSLGTQWGLFKHYWVLVKILLTIPATIILFLHMQPISYLAETALNTTISNLELRGLRIQLIANAGAALFVLLVATTLSVYKPWGRTRYGLRKNSLSNQTVSYREMHARKPWGKYVLLGLLGLFLLFVILHLLGGGLGSH